MEQDNLEEESRYDLPDRLNKLVEQTQNIKDSLQRMMENYGQTPSRRPQSPPADNASWCSHDSYGSMPELERVTLRL